MRLDNVFECFISTWLRLEAIFPRIPLPAWFPNRADQ